MSTGKAADPRPRRGSGTMTETVMDVVDTLGRPLRSLRISVTDRCNLRCQYCMPEQNYIWLPRADILHFEEVDTLVDVFIGLGVDKVRFTGGEPLLRRGLEVLVRMLAAKSGLTDLAMTTNGVGLAQHAGPLREAGLGRLTVSLDTLRPDRFRALTRRDGHDRVLEGIREASRLGYGSLKINAVVMRGVNDDEIVDLLEFGRSVGAQVRFIEYMDVGGATGWDPESVVGRREILGRLERHYGPIAPIAQAVSAPADRFQLPDGSTFGVIASTTAPFCRACDRARLTADGLFFMCLYARKGMDLRRALRGGATPEALAGLIAAEWGRRDDRGAEVRLGLSGRSPLAPRHELAADPHLEMHTRGG